MTNSSFPDWIGPVLEKLTAFLERLGDIKDDLLKVLVALAVLLVVALGLALGFGSSDAPAFFVIAGILFVFALLALSAYVIGKAAGPLTQMLEALTPVFVERLKQQPAPTPPAEQPEPEEDSECAEALTPEQQRACYLDALIADHRRMRLTGLDPNASDPRRGGMSLERLYVSLDTETPVRRERSEGDAERLAVSEARERPLTALEALVQADQGCMVLLGMPGAGKSTFVRYVTLHLARALRDGDFPLADRLPDWEGEPVIPIVISLGRLAEGFDPDAERGTAEMVEGFLSTACEADERLLNYGEHLLTELRERGGLVCFDGLDEVANLELRPIVRQAVEDFAKRYGRHARTRFLVTCRTFSYTDDRWQLTAWEQHRLAPLTPEKVHNFVDAWYDELNRVDPGRQAENERKCRRLHAALQPGDPRRLLEIADTPLILTVMAVVHGHRELPDSRAQVYEQCVDLLVNRWELERTPREEDVRKESLLEALQVETFKLQQALQKLAYRAHESETPNARDGRSALVTEEVLTSVLHPYFGSPDRVQTFIDYAEGANGLLMYYGRVRLPGTPADDPLQRVYVFPHLTFEEYLAGRYLERLGNVGATVRDHLDRGDRWREPVLMLGEYLCFERLDFERMNAVLDSLVPHRAPPRPETEDWRAVWVAGDLLVLYRRVFPEDPVRDERVVRRLIALLDAGALDPAERAAAGHTLGRLGDPRFSGELRLPEFIPLTGGEFRMGSTEEEVARVVEATGEDFAKRELPCHRVCVDGFALAKYPTTKAMYARFIEDDGYRNPAWWEDAPKGFWLGDGTVKDLFGDARTQPRLWDDERFRGANQPVVGVSWYEAAAYCRWLTATLDDGSIYRLPTEAEFAYAARGPEGRRYAWGDDWEPGWANAEALNLERTTPVGIFPDGATPEGLLDMTGNVWEWCADWFDETTYAERAGKLAHNPQGPKEGMYKVLRGGYWNSSEFWVRCAYRGRDFPDGPSGSFGFRVARGSPK